MVRSDFGATHTAEKTLGLIGASLAVRIGFLMVDALCQEAAVKIIPASGFVGIDGAAGRNLGFNRRDSLIFGFEYERQRTALTLAHNDNHAALGRTVEAQAAVAAINFPVGGANVPSEIGTVNFHLSPNLGDVCLFGHNLAELVRQNVSRPILDAKIAAQLKGANPLCAVAENGDS